MFVLLSCAAAVDVTQFAVLSEADLWCNIYFILIVKGFESNFSVSYLWELLASFYETRPVCVAAHQEVSTCDLIVIFADVNLLELGWMLMRMFGFVCTGQNCQEPSGGRVLVFA